MLKVENITKKYGKDVVLKNICFSIGDGEIAVLAGPNGAGKSTTIKSIAGLLRYDGIIELSGFNNKSIEGKRLLGYIPEMPALFPLLTIYEHLEFMAHSYGIKEYNQYAEDLLKLYDLWDKKDKFGSELSKGMMQKVSICCALITNPKILLIDEPMIGLDPKAIKTTKMLLNELRNNGTSILISTHLLDSVEGLWDKVLIMKNGEVVFAKTKEEMENHHKSLEEIFFEVTED
ncbi:ABC transporter ATP-binding protein [Clostridium fallax]|uniref:ABC-type multidrug transport system, ATPase component n=1 Tax=Clostridium fallax TaxID=1533 RepID=A0A1M4TTH6_9CLOT|nr:ABC transporter ATP-binding protein [Clostridium fallax]SHE47800.1 ABC-type multidrug transport system, ATPase component [Clostridium fallax]SQB22402.1 ABC transporter ATP-binding protein [Clostridium fallax]